LSFTGRHKEAIPEAKRAQELDPLSSYINARAGMAFQMAGLYDKAIEELQMALTLNPHFFFTHLNLGAAYFAKSMFRGNNELKMELIFQTEPNGSNRSWTWLLSNCGCR
jgi:tetratricopeptide (TPR) repeat protein